MMVLRNSWFNRFPSRLRWLSLIGLLGLLVACGPSTLDISTAYQFTNPSQDGLGKVYLGREIARTMGYEGAAWLDRPSRGIQERPQVLLEKLALQPTDVVADIGAGTGYLASRMAALVPEGRVLAVDVQPEMVAILQQRRQEQPLANLEPILGQVDSPNLPRQSVDVALMVDAYHEFEYPQEMMQGIVQALKPGGRVVLAEYRAENPLVMIKRLHKMSEAQVKREMAAAGLIWLKTESALPQQHLLFFQKPA